MARARSGGHAVLCLGVAGGEGARGREEAPATAQWTVATESWKGEFLS